MKSESKEERFVRVAEKRVQNILKAVKSLSQLANKKVYQWNDDQINKILSAIEDELLSCKQSFDDPDSKIFRLK